MLPPPPPPPLSQAPNMMGQQSQEQMQSQAPNMMGQQEQMQQQQQQALYGAPASGQQMGQGQEPPRQYSPDLQASYGQPGAGYADQSAMMQQAPGSGLYGEMSTQPPQMPPAPPPVLTEEEQQLGKLLEHNVRWKKNDEAWTFVERMITRNMYVDYHAVTTLVKSTESENRPQKLKKAFLLLKKFLRQSKDAEESLYNTCLDGYEVTYSIN